MVSLNKQFPCPPIECHGWPWDETYFRCQSKKNDSAQWPKVSIITPSFNQGQYLEETIRSVLLQDYPNLEYLILDGGSSDNSIEIIQKYEQWLSFWVSEPDGGQADAINTGMQKSTGEYIGWLNSDDLLYPSAIRRVVEAFRCDRDAELIFGDVEQGQNLQQGIYVLRGEQIEFSEMLRTLRVPSPQQGCLWKRSVIKRIGPLDQRWQVVLDREFFTRAAEKCRVRHLPGILGFFRNHEHSKSISQKRQWLVELPQMYIEFFERADLPLEIGWKKKETMGAVYLVCASITYQCGELLSSLRYLSIAIRTDPLIFFRSSFRSKLFKFLELKSGLLDDHVNGKGADKRN